ncbi:MAG TPA: PIN domain-containing protein [Thermoanaerobaculia bacterium]|jgi:hypothetical protein|nr:PIN domain-containing protein [Thermoanaerobaculia bacterium]
MPAAVLDSNLLVLLAVGILDRGMIREHKRTSQYVPEDFDLLADLLARFSLILVTPNGLTETANLLQQIREPYRQRLLAVLASLLPRLVEEYVPSKEAVASPIFTRLGLADAAIVESFPEAYVVTDDFDLYLYLANSGRRVINFNHYRIGAWGLADLHN